MASMKVKKAGLKIDDELDASFMLAGLPDEFRSLVLAVENSTVKLTIDGVKTILLQETRLCPTDNHGEVFFSKSKNLNIVVIIMETLVTWRNNVH